MGRVAVSLMAKTSSVRSLTLCLPFHKKCSCSVLQIWDWCRQLAPSKLCHRKLSQEKLPTYHLAPTRTQRSPSTKSSKRRTQELCRCRLRWCQANSRWWPTTSKGSLLPTRFKRSRTCRSQVTLFKKSNLFKSQKVNQKKLRRNRKRRVDRRVTEVIRATGRVGRPTRKRSTTIETRQHYLIEID